MSQWMIPDSQIPIQLGVQPTTGQSSTNETEQQVGVQPIVGHSSSDETGQQVPVQPNAGQSSSGETAQFSNSEKQIIVHPGAARERKPSKYNLSPYCPNFSSAGSSAKNISPCIYQKKHPFVDHPINAPLDTSFLQEYQKWLEKDLLKSHDKRKPNENHYVKNKEGLDLADAELRFHLGVTTVADKNWFYLLSMDGQLWTDEHIDVIFYYLRKKGKYHNNSNYRFTTASCIFHTLVAEIYKSWENPDSSTCVAEGR
ncbi:uncharacterized protein LOC132060901 isoform X1 [Lycium ferocissimum]|uniref:uncharacterized protein LOC132060901 isoform X1 n=1 Tax=Lycium ferocissimum TaxID=112874 RepID=UPI0028151CCA|nr:uncharacterized protein LOC132060901 isoform X1 [Lycium ferocissimum]